MYDIMLMLIALIYLYFLLYPIIDLTGIFNVLESFFRRRK